MAFGCRNQAIGALAPRPSRLDIHLPFRVTSRQHADPASRGRTRREAHAADAVGHAPGADHDDHEADGVTAQQQGAGRRPAMCGDLVCRGSVRRSPPTALRYVSRRRTSFIVFAGL